MAEGAAVGVAVGSMTTLTAEVVTVAVTTKEYVAFVEFVPLLDAASCATYTLTRFAWNKPLSRAAVTVSVTVSLITCA